MSLITFNAAEVPPQTPRAAWPKGKYRVAITQSEIKDVGSGGNKGIAFGAKALEKIGGGELPASTLLWNINFFNSNEQAQRIGRSELSSICHATGVMQLTDTANLHGHEFVVDLDHRFVQDKNEDGSPKVENGQPVGKTYNEVKGYYKKDGTAIVATATQHAHQPAFPSTRKPWEPAMEVSKPPVTVPASPLPEFLKAAPLPPVPAPVLPAAPEPLYYAARNGAYVNEQPVNLEALLALNLPPAEVKICQMGTNDWVDGPAFFAAHTVLPPWKKTQVQPQ